MGLTDLPSLFYFIFFRFEIQIMRVHKSTRQYEAKIIRLITLQVLEIRKSHSGLLQANILFPTIENFDQKTFLGVLLGQ